MLILTLYADLLKDFQNFKEEWDRDDKEKCFFYIGGIGLNPEPIPVNNTKSSGSNSSSSSSTGSSQRLKIV